MRIQVQTGNGKLRRSLRLLAAHHARRALHRLRELLPRVSVSLSDVVAAPGSPSKRCVVEMKSAEAGTVVVSSVAKNWQTAIKLALRSAGEKLHALWRADVDSRATRRLPLLRRPQLR